MESSTLQEKSGYVPHMMRARAVGVLAVTIGLTLGMSSVPALAQPSVEAPAESYLYVIDATYVEIDPVGRGTHAKVILTDARVTRFSDRPYRHEARISLNAMLHEFGRDPQTHRWSRPTPNAGVSVAGQRTEIVDIRKSHGDARRLVLHVRDVHRTLRHVSGTGAIFIDNVDLYPQHALLNLGQDLFATLTLWKPNSLTADVYERMYRISDEVSEYPVKIGTMNFVRGRGPTTVGTFDTENLHPHEVGYTPPTFAVQVDFEDTRVLVHIGQPLSPCPAKGPCMTELGVQNFWID